MGLVNQVALVSETERVGFDEIATVSAALQKQVMRDLAPIWEIRATVDPFASLDDVPLGYWPLIVIDDVEGAAGVHLDKDGQPYALIEAGTSWSLTASHECLEMLADPFGDRLVAGRSPKRSQGRVEFLVEICDPSEDIQFAYTVNDVLVSDFYTPSFFDPVRADGVRYSFGGHLRAPRRILDGGYLSWHDPVSDHWWQSTWFSGSKPRFVDLGIFSASDPRSIREIVDSRTPTLKRLSSVSVGHTRMKDCAALQSAARSSKSAKAELWRSQIAGLTRRK